MNWLPKRRRPSSRSVAPRPTYRPTVESLEDRLAPATITVTTGNDGPGTFTPATATTNASDTTLRGAIANASMGDTINFASSVITVSLTGGLDVTTSHLTFDGTGSNFTPGVTIDGSGINQTFSGFSIDLNLHAGADNCTIEGLAFVGAPIIGNANGVGLGIGSNNNLVQNCYIGLTASGNFQGNASDGIQVTGSHNGIGGVIPALGNYVCNNHGRGIEIGGADNVIMNNFVGINPAGAPQGNDESGIIVFSDRNSISGNVVCNNGGAGIAIESGRGNVIQSNFVGVDSNYNFYPNKGGAAIILFVDATVVDNTLGHLNKFYEISFPNSGSGGTVHHGNINIKNQTQATAAADDSGGQVSITKPDGTLVTRFSPFGSGFTGELRVTHGDINGDGLDDIIVAGGPGALSQVTVFDGQSMQIIASFYAFPNGFTGGVYVASADLNDDGFDDIVCGAGAGGGPQVTVYDGQTKQILTSFYAFDPSFHGGVRVGVEDVNGDRIRDIVSAAGPGGGPQVEVIDGNQLFKLQSNGQIANAALLASFYGLSSSFAGGVFVAVGDLNGDRHADIVVGADSGGGPQVTAWDGASMKQISSFYAYESGFAGGVRVGMGNFANTGHLRLLTSPGVGRSGDVKVFDGDTLAALGSFPAFAPGFSSGVFISGTR